MKAGAPSPLTGRSLIVVVSGPSGVGKSALIQKALSSRKSPKVRFSISATTRDPRGAERDGEHYRFLDEALFKKYIKDGAFIEWEKVHNHFYGTLRTEVDDAKAAGEDILLEIDVKGARKVREACPEAVTVFIAASPEVIEGRLRGRGTENESDVRVRLENARAEMKAAREYDYIVPNDVLEEAAADFQAILRAERLKNRAKRTAPAENRKRKEA